MIFSSILFLFRFLPIVLILYFVSPKNCRNLVLFLVSLVFYGWDKPSYILLMLFSTVLDYSVGRAIEYSRKRGSKVGAKLSLLCSVVVNLGLLGFFKYSNFVIETVNSVFGTGIAVLNVTLPIGISFYTFQTLSYSIDVYRGRVDAQHNIITFGAYVSMFPQLIAGPIVQYKTVAKELNSRTITVDGFAYGIRRFMLGLSKKVLIANTVGELFSQISATTEGLTTATAWLGIIAFTLQIYFDFSGYSDMAIGLGRMFGFKFNENFLYPYQSKSITEFWRRWHISLSSFFKEYLYIPLGGNRKGKARQILNLFIVWALTGLWHGASWNFVLWGLYYFVILVIEKFVLKKLLDKAPAVVSHFYTVVLFVIGWAIFAYPDMADGGYFVSVLLGNGAFADGNTAYYLSNYAVVIVIGILFSTDIPKRVYNRFFKAEVPRYTVQIAFCAVAFVLCVAFLVSDSYNPFLYFRF
ncbi:MAG: MBOAT family protein [Ruminococcaceae bacterium]|nr:MBOAT family protein [Oscillospiraceae bacterium]